MLSQVRKSAVACPASGAVEWPDLGSGPPAWLWRTWARQARLVSVNHFGKVFIFLSKQTQRCHGNVNLNAIPQYLLILRENQMDFPVPLIFNLNDILCFTFYFKPVLELSLFRIHLYKWGVGQKEEMLFSLTGYWWHKGINTKLVWVWYWCAGCIERSL